MYQYYLINDNTGICGNFSGVQKVMITDGLKNSKKYNHEKGSIVY